MRVSGINENRPGLNEIPAKAYNGEIDLIITKAISRFAENLWKRLSDYSSSNLRLI